jgi:hypothetical protein
MQAGCLPVAFDGKKKICCQVEHSVFLGTRDTINGDNKY